MFGNFIESISQEILEIKKSHKKKYINVEYYTELNKFNSKYFIYEIYVSEYVSKMAEDLSIELISKNHKLDAIITSIDENQIIKIKTKEKLTEEIYRINMEFNPSFLLVNLLSCIEGLKDSKNPIVNNLKSFTINDKINIDIGNLEYEELNESQIKAIKHSEENQISLIWGPPGTGKTHTLSKIIYRSFLRDEKILVLSTSNVALDQILLKLDKDIYSDEKKYIVRLGNTNNKKIYEYTVDSKTYNKEQEKNITFATLANLSMKYHKLEDFDLVVIDEVSMVSLPYIFIAGNKSKRNLVLLGDFNQLPPISLSKDNNSFLLNIYDYLDIPKKIDNNIDVPYMSMLDTQYRMTKTISTLVSTLFYNNLLNCGVEKEHENALNFINIDGSSYQNTYFSISDTSYFNPISLFLIDTIVASFKEPKEFLVVSPFRPQQNILNGYFRDKKNLDGKSLTVHKAQGSEADIVFFDLTTHKKTNKTNYHHFFINDMACPKTT